MILDDDVEFIRLRHRKQFDESVCATNLLLVGVSLADRIHANRVTTNLFRKCEPLLVIRRELRARRFVGRTAQSFTVAHHEFALDAKVVTALAEFAPERLFTNAARVELIHEFDARDAELLFRDLREVHRIGGVVRAFLGLPKTKASVQRPLRERDRIGKQLRRCLRVRGARGHRRLSVVLRESARRKCRK